MAERKIEAAHILVVDDSKVTRLLLTRHLEQQGYLVSLAEHGKEALEMLAENSYDLVLLDVEMPELDGYQTLETMKGNQHYRHLPVIMVTSIDDTDSAVRCIEFGAEDYLPKPFNPVLLQARVGASLEKKRLHDQEQAYLKGLERELEIGRDIQMGFLPDELPQVEGWEIVASLKAAREVAGDFYDAYALETDESICLVIGDVCDKGVGAALFMTLFRSLLRFTMGATDTFGESSPAKKLKYAVSLTNNYIEKEHGTTGMFATIFFGLLNPKDGMLSYINAGHEYPIILSPDGEQRALKTTGLALGVMPDWEYGVEQIQMNNGDLLFAYTDGASEMTDSEGNFFGKDRLMNLLNSDNKTASALVDKINTELIKHIGNSYQFDDITLMALKRLMPSPSSDTKR